MGAGLSFPPKVGWLNHWSELNLNCCWEMVPESEHDLDLNSLRTCWTTKEQRLSLTPLLPLYPRSHRCH